MEAPLSTSPLREQFAHLLDEDMCGDRVSGPSQPVELPAPVNAPSIAVVGDETTLKRAVDTGNRIAPLVIVGVGVVVAFLVYTHREELLAFCRGGDAPKAKKGGASTGQRSSLVEEEEDDDDDEALELESEREEEDDEQIAPAPRTKMRPIADPMFEPL